MSCFSRRLVVLFSCALCLAPTPGAARDFLLGAGVEGDTADGLRFSGLGGISLGEKTWLAGTVGQTRVELPTGTDSETMLASLEIDHHFDPLGVRAGVSYWGDPDILESADWNVAVYFRNDRVTLAAEYEYRDFDFTIPRTDFFAGRTIRFDADGLGASARFRLGERASLSLAGTKYDYSVDFRPTRDRDILDLISATRLSLINSLVDSRGRLTFGLDFGFQRLALDLATAKGAVDGTRTRSVTLRYLFPAGKRSDLELGLGYDDSDVYGDVTFFSLFFYFYGAD